MHILKKNKIMIFLLFVFFFAIGTALNAYKVLTTVKISLTFNYLGIERGLNPDGSKFNVFEIKSKEVLGSIIEKLSGSSLTIDEIKRKIIVESVMPKAALEQVRTEQTEGNQYYYIPYEFSIAYIEPDPFEKIGPIQVLNALSEAYTEFFFENYAEKNTILQDEKINTDGYEYIEIAGIYSNRINSMINYLYSHRKENEEFRAESTGETFGDIIYMLTNLRDIDVEKYRSHVLQTSIAKDRPSYLQKIKYIDTTLKRSYEQEKNNTQFISDTLKKYDAKITSSLFIPTTDENNKLYMNKTQTGLDYITQRAYTSGLNAESIGNSINLNDHLIKAFSKNVWVSGTDLELTNKMLTDINAKLRDISELALKTDNEFMDKKTMNYLSFSKPVYAWGNLTKVKDIAVLSVISLFLAYLFAAMKENIKSRRVKKKAASASEQKSEEKMSA